MVIAVELGYFQNALEKCCYISVPKLLEKVPKLLGTGQNDANTTKILRKSKFNEYHTCETDLHYSKYRAYETK